MKFYFLNLLLFPLVCYCQYTSIPDPVFENVLINYYGLDTIQDGQILTSNISGVQYLDVSGFGISDLTGIEDFTSLEYLDCYSNMLTNLDVSNCSNLGWLDCESNFLSTLDVSQNISLQTLWCYENQLQSINVNGCVNLQDFEFDNNLLTSLDLSTNINLIHIDAWNNLLHSLDVSNCQNLQSLEIFNNNLLECLNLKNGNNSMLYELEINNTLNLSCIEVDDSSFSANNWINNSGFIIDSNHYFSNHCNYSSSCFLLTNVNKNLINLNIYPNPTFENITVDIENFNGNIRTEVFDLVGNRLQLTSEKTISLRDYSKGIYILKIVYGDRVKEVKVIKD